MTINCSRCGRFDYLIFGYCQNCEPELHNTWKSAGDAVAAMAELFKQDTGKEALSCWNTFEQWLLEPLSTAKKQALIEMNRLAAAVDAPHQLWAFDAKIT